VKRGGHVLDASALLCLLFGETGSDRVERVLPDAFISAANLAEVISKLVDRGLDGKKRSPTCASSTWKRWHSTGTKPRLRYYSAPRPARRVSRSAIGPAWLWPSKGACSPSFAHQWALP
jgi:hypothetical protein